MKILPLPFKQLNLRVARITTQKIAVSSHATDKVVSSIKA